MNAGLTVRILTPGVSVSGSRARRGAPAPSPCLKRLLINEQTPKGSLRIRTIRRVTQPPERHCEVNLVVRKQAEEFVGKLQIAICLG